MSHSVTLGRRKVLWNWFWCGIPSGYDTHYLAPTNRSGPKQRKNYQKPTLFHASNQRPHMAPFGSSCCARKSGTGKCGDLAKILATTSAHTTPVHFVTPPLWTLPMNACTLHKIRHNLSGAVPAINVVTAATQQHTNIMNKSHLKIYLSVGSSLATTQALWAAVRHIYGQWPRMQVRRRRRKAREKIILHFEIQIFKLLNLDLHLQAGAMKYYHCNLFINNYCCWWYICTYTIFSFHCYFIEQHRSSANRGKYMPRSVVVLV